MPPPQAGLSGRAPLPGPGSPDPWRAQCPSPAASVRTRQPRVAPNPRALGTLAAAGDLRRARPHPGGAGDSPAPRANPRAPAAALRTPLPPAPCPLPRAVSFGSTGVWGRRGRSWPPRPPSSGALGGEGAEG